MYINWLKTRKQNNLGGQKHTNDARQATYMTQVNEVTHVLNCEARQATYDSG